MKGKIEYYAGELNRVCIMICVLIILLHWMQTFTPDIYAALQVFMETISNTQDDGAADLEYFANFKI